MGLTASNNISAMAGKLLQPDMARSIPKFDPTVNREFQIRFTAGVLVLLTAAAVTLAWINFRKESQFVPPYDGVLWMERGQV